MLDRRYSIALWVGVLVTIFIILVTTIVLMNKSDYVYDDYDNLYNNDDIFLTMNVPFDHVPVVPNQYIVIFHTYTEEENSTSTTEGISSSSSSSSFDMGNEILMEYQKLYPRSKKLEQLLIQQQIKNTIPQIIMEYNSVLKGIAIRYVSNRLFYYMLQHPYVKYIEEDVLYELSSAKTKNQQYMRKEQENDGTGGTDSGTGTIETTSSSIDTSGTTTKPYVPWNLDRIDQKRLPLDGYYTFDPMKTTGENVFVFVLDSGIYKKHNDFATNQVECVYSAYDAMVKDDTDEVVSEHPCHDHLGHGTHVAGIIGGLTSGVAKGVQLLNVKITKNNGFTSSSAILGGIDFVVQMKIENTTRPTIMQLSVNGPVRIHLNQAITHAVEKYNIIVVVPAGNHNGKNACSYSPSNIPAAITVGATNQNDEIASLSNIGECIQLFAPGEDITSASIDNNERVQLAPVDDDYNVIDIDSVVGTNSIQTKEDIPVKTLATDMTEILSGTSMAAAHVTGVIALYLHREPNLTSITIKKYLNMYSTHNQLMNVQGNTQNILLNMNHFYNIDWNITDDDTNDIDTEFDTTTNTDSKFDMEGSSSNTVLVDETDTIYDDTYDADDYGKYDDANDDDSA